VGETATRPKIPRRPAGSQMSSAVTKYISLQRRESGKLELLADRAQLRKCVQVLLAAEGFLRANQVVQ
jgi:hypothetical protein